MAFFIEILYAFCSRCNVSYSKIPNSETEAGKWVGGSRMLQKLGDMLCWDAVLGFTPDYACYGHHLKLPCRLEIRQDQESHIAFVKAIWNHSLFN